MSELTMASRIAAGTAGALLVFGGCAEQSDTVATLDETQHTNLKLASATHIKDLLAPYTREDRYSDKGELGAYSYTELEIEDDEFGGLVEFSQSDDVTFVVDISPDGAELTVTRTSTQYCVDPETEDIIKSEDCDADTDELTLDTGYEATYLNPDITAIDVDAELTVKSIKRFIQSEGTYIASVGNRFGDTLHIDQDGTVTAEGYIRGIDSQEETVRTLSDYVNHP